jgi:hypothetical protein
MELENAARALKTHPWASTGVRTPLLSSALQDRVVSLGTARG